MNSGDMILYRTLIEARIAELSMRSENTLSTRKTVELDQQSVGRLSRMDAIERKAMADATERRRRQETEQLKLALKRLEGGEFGACVDCGEEIPAKRLAQNPAVQKCISCARG